MPAILFVCTANRFRSPIAAAAFREELKSTGTIGNWCVGSAGTWTEAGNASDKTTIEIAGRLGLSIEEHSSCPVSADLLAEYDMILVMESGQKEAIRNEFPAARDRVFLLSEIADNISYDIPDPATSRESSGYEIAREVRDLVRKGFQNICSKAEFVHASRTSL